MKIWRVVIRNKKNVGVDTIWGTAVDYQHAGTYGLNIVKAEYPKEEGLWVETVECYGDKRF